MKYILTIMLSGLMVSALAVQPQAENTSGAYINANAGIGILQYLPTGSFVFSANAGYNFNRAFAVEGGWTNLASSQFGATAYDNFVDVAVKGTLPLSNVFSLYGRLGVGINYTSFNGTASGAGSNCLCSSQGANNFAGLAGIGASFALSRHFDLRLEDFMILPAGGGNTNYGNINVVSGGVQFNF